MGRASSHTDSCKIILFASLAVSLLSAFLAMLVKQWLNRYASTGMRGSAVEHSKNQQRKVDGIVVCYLERVGQQEMIDTVPRVAGASEGVFD